MATTLSKFPPNSQVDFRHSHPVAASGNLTCLIYSNHPLAFCFIKDAVCSDGRLCSSVRRYSNEAKPANCKGVQILVIDTCSVANWVGFLDRWRLEHGLAIALVASEARTNELELQMLYLGAGGVLTLGENLADHLPKAILEVAQGHLWIRRGVLSLYIQRANSILHNTSISDHGFTNRELQILELLQRELTNRAIAQRFALSERTIKFHVSNILHKMNVADRRELRALQSPTKPFFPDWLLHQNGEATPLPFVSMNPPQSSVGSATTETSTHSQS